MTNELRNIVWQEKYRPKHVTDVISPFTEKITKAMENPKAIQNFIFYSRMGGTGKTSLAKAITCDLGCDVLNLNASDDRTIEVIRTRVKDFMIMQAENPNSKKCIMMDEGEKLTKDAADALKNMMEEYSANAFIIMTTNNISKIPEPLQTRFKIYTFTQPDKDKIKQYLIDICTKEWLSYSDDGINTVIETYYPSIRKMVNELQDLHNQGKSVEPENILTHEDIYQHLWDQIKQRQYKQVRTQIIEQGVDCEDLNKYIFNTLIKTNDIELKKEIKIIQTLARNERDFKLGADKMITFISSLVDLMKVFEGEK